MREIELNGKRLVSENMAMTYLFDMFEFSDYYGDNLEALYDALADILEDTKVTIINRAAMEQTSFGARLIWVLEDAASDNGYLQLIWTEPRYDDYE